MIPACVWAVPSFPFLKGKTKRPERRICLGELRKVTVAAIAVAVDAGAGNAEAVGRLTPARKFGDLLKFIFQSIFQSDENELSSRQGGNTYPVSATRCTRSLARWNGSRSSLGSGTISEPRTMKLGNSWSFIYVQGAICKRVSNIAAWGF